MKQHEQLVWLVHAKKPKESYAEWLIKFYLTFCVRWIHNQSIFDALCSDI